MTEEHIEHLGNGACDGRDDGSAAKNVVSDPDGGSDIAYIASKPTETEQDEPEPDSREKLEADVLRYHTYTTSTLMWPDSANIKTKWLSVPMDKVLEWLDRQAAITKRDTLHDNPMCSGSSTCAANQPISESDDRETSETVEIGAPKSKISDSDVWSVAYEIYCAGGYADNDSEPNPPTDGIRKLLDRQAAIAHAEVNRDGESTEVIGAICPFTSDGACHTNCMLFATAVDSDVTYGDMGSGDGHCSLAVMASHIASERHHGGNYLVASVARGNVG